jgi:hypothetical protein
MSNAKVQVYIRKLLAKMGLADEIINAVDKELDLAIDKAEKAEKDVLSQMPPKQSVSPTNQTVVRPSSIPSTNSTNPGSPLAQARQRARKGSSTKP